jgi:GNAT superfamily N-acetyltransferase
VGVYAKWIANIGREPFPMSADHDKAVVEHDIYLLEVDGALIALVELVRRSDHLFVENLAVAELAQGRGIGQRLLGQAEEFAQHWGFAEIKLSTNKAFASNVAFYLKRGYEIEREETLFDGGTGVWFRKGL